MGWPLNSIFFLISAIALIINKYEHPLAISVAFSFVSGIFVFKAIPILGPYFIKVGFYGKDLNKKGKPLKPEAMGIVCSMVYIYIMFLFIPFAFYKYFVMTSGGGNRDIYEVVRGEKTFKLFFHNKLGEYLSAILSLQSMVLLGAADDLFDIRWRDKLFMPVFSAIPILVVYYIDFDVTYVVVPTILQPYFGNLIEIGWLYYLYMAALSVFCPNSINIIAGINGVEVGQSIIISLCIIINDLLYVFRLTGPSIDSHLFSLYFLLPFLGTSIPLLYYNWYPASVFVGDTYCCFSGMIFAIVGIIGHFSKTILLFFIPQIFNFILSFPQLFGIVECPRHRMPNLNLSTGLLEPSMIMFSKKPSLLCRIILKIFSKLGFVRLKIDPITKEIQGTTNLTIINFLLVRLGPRREDKLTIIIMGIQAVMGLIGLFIRHKMAKLIYLNDNY
ncbi:hypothetical protein T552_01921 [Pneumocystis carinii B80]|uniref:UDP-N-acetylglucosamine--dolichyl-phosphate N-acetylglucosaminephosphotransferase n=1 Tax=Pneumocystis carinii (strain B80) TaxID=1408658 RepID=A0A0W4ZI62_PNEC8|nr:hypothetical protein T552_01921 [Pneumocystis carinii B80]KTW28059.1 hypothetical protein T552_01921 [Pneumocystis carinii B80]